MQYLLRFSPGPYCNSVWSPLLLAMSLQVAPFPLSVSGVSCLQGVS
ncbi:unnamed protein product [Linum tenue]|uniref:Uncharacterized protein n=1 Tax=Linum tenue TaxID=586396 RepID=A0AAV0LPG6_9ROSI|nr:unnamed protein product [Linum tenue]